MRTILLSSLIAIAGCATNPAEQPDTTAGGKADEASEPSGTFTNPAPHAGELSSLTLGTDGTFSRSTLVECALAVDCPPLVDTGTYELTHAGSTHYIHFYGDDGGSLDRIEWQLVGGNLELSRDGSSWFELDAMAPHKLCGGFRGARCDDGEYCEYGPTGHCGAVDRAGTCMPIPTVCTEEDAPVCGCDGRNYGNACEANEAGFSVWHDGACN